LTDTGFTLPPKLYDFLKWIALIVLPAVAALVITVGSLIHWDGAVVTAGVLTAVDTFLGLLLGKGSSNFAQSFGDLIVQQDVDGTPMGLKVVGKHENPVFEDGGKVYLNVKREQLLEKPTIDPRFNHP
jgi:Putative phage holin Dp-1